MSDKQAAQAGVTEAIDASISPGATTTAADGVVATVAADEHAPEQAPFTSLASQGAFTAELGGAMRSAADGWHARLKEEAERYRQTEAARIGARAEAEASELRASIDGSRAEIDAAAQESIRKVEEERAARVTALHQVLDERLDLHRSVIASEVAAADGAIDTYLTYLDGFFERLATEKDPEVIARLAGSIPPLPDVDAATAAARSAAEAEITREADRVARSNRTPIPAEEIAPEMVPVMDPAVTVSARSAGAPVELIPEDDATVSLSDATSDAVADTAPDLESVGAASSAKGGGSILRGIFGRGDGKSPPAGGD